MIKNIDIKLIQNNANYDIELDENGDLLSTDGFDTSILMSLGTDSRASQSEVSVPYNRRGFIGDEFFEEENFKHGSKLWLLEQARVNNNTRNLAVNYCELALKWMIDENYLNSLNVTGSLKTSGIDISITGITQDGNTESFSYNVWSNTLRNL